MRPAPEQASQRPPDVLKEKKPAPCPRIEASGKAAKRSRIRSQAPMYVAGVERGVLPMGSWSTITSWRKDFRPVRLWNAGLPPLATTSVASLPWRPSFFFEIANWAAGATKSVMSVLFPAPETPQTTESRPVGKATSKCLRLRSEACFTRIHSVGASLPAMARRVPRSGCGIADFSDWPVTDAGLASRSWAVPSAMMRPPWTPAPGPRSMMRSAARMVSSSCSTTRTVLPRSRSPRSDSMSRSLSRGCRPMLGSSRT